MTWQVEKYNHSVKSSLFTRNINCYFLNDMIINILTVTSLKPVICKNDKSTWMSSHTRKAKYILVKSIILLLHVLHIIFWCNIRQGQKKMNLAQACRHAKLIENAMVYIGVRKLFFFF